MDKKYLKQIQLFIINSTNKAEPDNCHTWIREINDIFSFEELKPEILTPDYTEEMFNQSLSSKTIKVFSSYPIEQGVFVTPSKMEAQSYAGHSNKVYEMNVNVDDIAWIDSIEGQYAKVNKEWIEKYERQGN